MQEYFNSSAYAGMQHKFGNRLTVAALAEYLRSWRVQNTQYAIAQALLPGGRFDFRATRHWNVQGSFVLSRGMGYHFYDNAQSELLVSYTRGWKGSVKDGEFDVPVSFPMRFSVGVQQQTFYNFPGSSSVNESTILPVCAFHPVLVLINQWPSSQKLESAMRRPTLRLTAEPGHFAQKLLGGSLTLLAGSSLVGVTNLVYNVLTARMLGPTGFAHATAVYTLLMLASAITLSFQVVCAKYVASHEDESGKKRDLRAASYPGVDRGTAIGLLLFLFNGTLQHYLNLPDPGLISWLALGTAFYIPLGVRRGYIQGVHAFRALALNFMLEGLVRLGGAYLLILLGLGVQGAVLASVIAVIASYFLAKPIPRFQLHARRMPMPFGEGVQAIVFFCGQVVINNFDIVLVKHFFVPMKPGFMRLSRWSDDW